MSGRYYGKNGMNEGLSYDYTKDAVYEWMNINFCEKYQNKVCSVE